MADVAQKNTKKVTKNSPVKEADTSKQDSRQPWDVSDKSVDDSASNLHEDVETPHEGVDTEAIRGKHEDRSYVNLGKGEDDEEEGHAETGYPPAGKGSNPNESQADVSQTGDEAQEEGEEGEDVVAAGTINDKGEVVDDEGNIIGHIEGDFDEKISGNVVDNEGDVIDSEGNVVAKAGLEDLQKQVPEISEKDLPDDKVEDIKDELPEDVQSEAPSTIRSKLPSLLSKIPDLASRLPSEAVPSEIAESLKSGAPKSPVDSAKDLGEDAEGNVPEEAGDALGEATSKVGDAADETTSKAGEAVEENGVNADDLSPEDAVGETKSKAGSAVDETTSKVGSAADEATSKAGDAVPEEAGEAVDEAGSKVDEAVPEDAEGAIDENASKAEDAVPEGEEVGDAVDEAKEGVEETAEDAAEEGKEVFPDISILEGCTVNKSGNIVNEEGKPVGKLVEGEAKKLVGKKVDKEGKIWNDSGKVIGVAEVLPEVNEEDSAPFESFPDAKVDKNGLVIFEGQQVGIVIEGDIAKLVGKTVDEDGDILDKHGNAIGKAERKDAEEPAEPEPEAEEPVDYSQLAGKKVNKAGNVVDEKGALVGRVSEGTLKNLIGRVVDENGDIFNDSGKKIGHAEPIPENEREEQQVAPFEDFPEALVEKDGLVRYEGQVVGKLIEGDAKQLAGKKVDADGDVVDKNGNVLGKAERYEEEEPEAEPEQTVDYSQLAGKKVNKAGNVVDDKGAVVGRICEGVLKVLIGRKVDENGDIFNDSGKKIGKAEPIPDSEREDFKEPSPFEDFPDAVVEKDGFVRYEGEVVGKLVEGDAKKLHGKKVDPDGDVVDKNGNVLGKVERYEEEEPEPEPEVQIDNSQLAGKRVNKAGNVVDSNGVIYGRLVEGDVKRLVGKMCDKQGFVRNEGGDVIGKAELVPEAEREGLKEGPFAEFEGCTVNKEGKVVTPSGEVVGRLIEGDAAKLHGRQVDEDGEILDKNGNSIGKAERWEEPQEEKEVNPMSGRRVNKAGDVVDENGDVVGKLTDGELRHCVGKKIDDDGDVVDGKGNKLGHVTLLEYIPEPEEEPEPEPEVEEEDPKAKEEREQAEADAKLAKRLSFVIEDSLGKLQPLLNMITSHINKADATDKDELDEEELVKQVKPLIEEGGRILTETNGAIRGLDPDGRISAQAKHNTASREATPEEYRLAELLKELTNNVHQTIENAKRKIEGMPHAKKELNPLWGLLAEPLGQILAAVGLLLSGVLGLVGRLLSVLGLGGLLDNLLGSLGLKGILQGLGLGSLTDSLTGKKSGGGKKKGGLGGLLG